MKTRLTLRPGQDGTKQELEKYGGALVCIRFSYDVKSRKRLKTVELIVEQTDWTRGEYIDPQPGPTGPERVIWYCPA